MAKMAKDPVREERIEDDIVVDCYDEDERVSGWWHYLSDEITFPFQATCREKRSHSPLKVGEEVEVIGMAEQDDCEREMFVLIRRMDDELGVPLAQIQPVESVDDNTRQAVGDWHYWVGMGYEF